MVTALVQKDDPTVAIAPLTVVVAPALPRPLEGDRGEQRLRCFAVPFSSLYPLISSRGGLLGAGEG